MAGLDLLKQVAIPGVALAAGGVCVLMGLRDEEWKALRDIGKLAVYFGAQTGMNLYMKAVLSKSTVDTKGALLNGLELHHNLRGIPAAFAVTAIQQITAFILFMGYIIISRRTSCAYAPKRLTSGKEWMAVVLFSLSFTLNIALNNYSLSLISISVNLIIRSCLPLSTFMSQQVAARCTHEQPKDCRFLEIFLMILGVACAALAVVAKTFSRNSDKSSDNDDHLALGVIVCILSLFSGSINLALAGVLGTSVELNALDSTVYMAVPATLFLLGPIFFMAHPVGGAWEEALGSGRLTDWQIFTTVCQLSPVTVFLALLSGVFALGYNVLQYTIVQSLSATHTAFAGNFNKAATIALALVVGLETLPSGTWGAVMLLAVLGNIVAFTAYNMLKVKAKDFSGHGHGHGGGAQVASKYDEQTDDDGEDEDDSGSDSHDRGCL